MEYHKLYKVDTKGKVRVWYAERDHDRYRMWDGILGGKVKCSEWRLAEPTNVGRSNERDGIAQADFEVLAHYKKKMERDYHDSIEESGRGSHIFKVMLAEKYKAKPKDVFEPGFGQPKLDGFRAVASRGSLVSRAGKPFPSCPHVLEALTPLLEGTYEGLILDGELYNHELHDDFNEIQSLITTKGDKSLTPEHFEKTRRLVQYHVYDLPSHPGTFSERTTALKALIESLGDQDVVKYVETVWFDTEDEYDRAHEGWLEAGYEGSIWRANTKYENKRSKGLRKRKEFEDQEFVVVRKEEGKGNWAGACKRVVCWLPGADRSPGPNETNTFEAGVRGTKERNVELLKEHHDQVTIRFFGWTPSEVPKPRFGVATKWHVGEREY